MNHPMCASDVSERRRTFWLSPVRVAKSRRFGDHELHTLQKLVEDNRDSILEAWNEHFSH